jgi:hypothetical protein
LLTSESALTAVFKYVGPELEDSDVLRVKTRPVSLKWAALHLSSSMH